MDAVGNFVMGGYKYRDQFTRDAPRQHGHTAFQVACMCGHPDCVELLVRAGCDTALGAAENGPGQPRRSKSSWRHAACFIGGSLHKTKVHRVSPE